MNQMKSLRDKISDRKFFNINLIILIEWFDLMVVVIEDLSTMIVDEVTYVLAKIDVLCWKVI